MCKPIDRRLRAVSKRSIPSQAERETLAKTLRASDDRDRPLRASRNRRCGVSLHASAGQSRVAASRRFSVSCLYEGGCEQILASGTRVRLGTACLASVPCEETEHAAPPPVLRSGAISPSRGAATARPRLRSAEVGRGLAPLP
jgi:hypothetical protein